MAITVEAVYEDGVLKPNKPLSLNERAKVKVTVHTPEDIQAALAAVQRSYGLLRWTGDLKVLRRIAEEDEFGILESS